MTKIYLELIDNVESSQDSPFSRIDVTGFNEIDYNIVKSIQELKKPNYVNPVLFIHVCNHENDSVSPCLFITDLEYDSSIVIQ